VTTLQARPGTIPVTACGGTGATVATGDGRGAGGSPVTPVEVPGYRIDPTPLGRGRHGELLAGVRRSDGAAVAVEVVDLDPDVASRLAVEAAALRGLPESPQLLPVLDVGAEGRSAWLVSPRPERVVADGPALPADDLGRLLVDAALGLAALHSGGFVHGALAPAALTQLANGRFALWGYAVPVLAEQDEGPHRPPEIRRGAEWSVAADIWALGSAVRALSTGTVLPPRVAAVLDDMLADDPGARPQSAQEVVERVRRAPADDPLLTAGPARPVATSPGRPLGSGYLLDEPIGRGATGQVWRGRRRSDDAAVAVKVLRSELAEDAEVVARFLAERSTLTGLSSPHLVRVLDLVAESGTLALVMELVDGADLRRSLATGKLSASDGVRVLAQVADGLAAVHAAGIVHRDLKPENVLVGHDGSAVHAWLTDFGVARTATPPGGSRLTRTSRLVGTPEYVAPELAAGRPATGAADIYALGVLAYEVLSGRRPFDAEHPAALLRAHLEDAPSRPAGMSDDAWTVISGCLAKEPTDRPDATRASAAFLALVGREPTGVTLGALPVAGDVLTPPPYLSPAAPVGVEALPTMGASVAAPEAPPEPVVPKSRRGLWLAIAAGVVVIAVGTAAGIWAGRPDGGSATPSSSPKATPYRGGVQIPVVADSPERGSVRLRFPSGPSVPGVQSFFVIRDSGVARQSIDAGANEWSQTGLDPGTEHCWRVFALVESPTPIPSASPQDKTCLKADGARS
jgi:hypothetical protein